MTNITDLDQLNTWSDSRVIINDNFTNLNNDKVEVEAGKWLSENDFTDADKSKLDWIESGAEANTLNDIMEGTNVTIDKTDPLNPIINASWWSWDMTKAVYDPQTIEADAFDTDNHTDWTTTKVFQLTDRENITTNAVTGMLSWGAITINSWDNTTFDMASYKAQFVDHAAGIITIVEGAWFTAVTPTIISGDTVADVFLESNWTLSYANGVTPKQRRSKIIMTRVGVPWGQWTQIFDLFERTQLSFDWNLSDTDAFSIFAPIMNVGGNNTYTANWANLSLNKSAGEIFERGVNYYVDAEDPDIATTPAETLLSFRYVYRNGSGGATVWPLVTEIDPEVYDDGSGTLQTVPNKKFTVPRIYLAPNNLTLVEPWQVIHNSLNDAKLAISSSPHVRTVSKSSLLRSALIIKEDVNDLTTTNKALFLIADELGKLGGGGSTAASGVDLQTSYNQSVQPQIVTSATLWALQIQRGSASDTDNVLEIANWAWTVTASIDWNWDTIVNSLTTNWNTNLNWNNIVWGWSVAITWSYTGTDYNWVALTNAWLATNFLQEDGNYWPTGGGGMTLLTTTNISSPVSQIDFTSTIFDWTYDWYIIKAYLEADMNWRVFVNFSNNDLSSMLTIWSMHFVAKSTSTTQATSLNNTIWIINQENTSFSSEPWVWFEMKINSTVEALRIMWGSSYVDTGFSKVVLDDFTMKATAWNSMRLYPSAWNFDAWFVSIYWITT